MQFLLSRNFVILACFLVKYSSSTIDGARIYLKHNLGYDPNLLVTVLPALSFNVTTMEVSLPVIV